MLKIVNFKLNCVRSKVLPLVKDSQFRTFSLFAPRIVSMRFEKKFLSEHSRRRHGNMIDLCPRAYSNYLKYHTRHDYSKKIAKFSIFLMLSFVCFVFSEGMWNGVQVNPPSLLSTTHSCRFENFVKYFFKDRRRDQRTNVTFAVVYAFKNHAMSSDYYYLLGSQYVTHWFYFRVPVYELKAGCAWAIFVCCLAWFKF